MMNQSNLDNLDGLVDQLNERQREAVLDFQNPLLVLAGAGSGKTRMLTHKIAYGIEKNYFNSQSFLAVTFTNKAAGEMKQRVSELVDHINLRESWLTTFHSFGNRVLRSHGSLVGHGPDFTIFDSTDQISLIKSLLKSLKYDHSSASARRIAGQINSLKSDIKAQQDLDSYPWPPQLKEIYPLYSKELMKLNAMDFADLLLKTHWLLQKHPQVVEGLQNQFEYILVDEYQDTNLIQYEILKKLSRDRKNICVVGDEDQSIYSWRGADIFNILNFHKDFPQARTIKMEQNYRSTQTIIKAAGAVISHNIHRKGKKLFTDNSQGDLIETIESPTEYEEAMGITYGIQKLMEQTDYNYSDVAIFYRTNAQSRILEEKLRNSHIPYEIFGGLKFYDRREIKDINAYMRLVANPKDDVSFRRVFNTPTRGLGAATLDKVITYAGQMNLSLIEASIELINSDELTNRTKTKIQSFLHILEELRTSCEEKELYGFYQDLLQISQYLPSLEKERTLEAQSRIQNLEEFGNAIVRYMELNPRQQHITQFLHHMALMSDPGNTEDEEHKVTLMTLHLAKGLEFPVVYITGLEEGLFPHTGMDPGNDLKMEEERRLFYVGMTRAKEKLFLSYAQQRKIRGQNSYQAPSLFISEVPEVFLKNQSPKRGSRFMENFSSQASTDSSFQGSNPFPDYERGDSENSSPYREGTRVRHPHFGRGVIRKVEGQGAKEKVGVLFDDQTYRKFLSQYANLEL